MKQTFIGVAGLKQVFSFTLFRARPMSFYVNYNLNFMISGAFRVARLRYVLMSWGCLTMLSLYKK